MLLKKYQSGFYLFELIIGVTVLCSLLSLGTRYTTRQVERSVNQLTAQQLQQITQAAQQYVQDHFQTFQNNNNHPLNWQILVDEGYLPSTLSNKNHYDQTYHFTVNTVDGQLQLLLTTTGGQAISEACLRQIAAIAGSAAGFASILHPNEIVGIHKGWRLTGVPLATGHLASLILLNEHEVMDATSFLRRVKIAGRPEFNRMDTDLIMAQHQKIFFENDNNKLQVGDGKVTLYGNNGSHISIHGGGNKFFEIEHPTGERMQLWSNHFSLSKNDNASYAIIDHQGELPHIELKGDSKVWKTKIKPAEIRLTSDWSRKESYLGNDYLSYHDHKTDYSMELNAESIKTGKYPYPTMGITTVSDYRGLFSEVTAHYLKIPFIEVLNNFSGWRDEAIGICDSKEREGAMFITGLKGSGSRLLSICANGSARTIASWS